MTISEGILTNMYWRNERPIEFQWVDLKVVKLQIKKVRDPSRWKERDEEKLNRLIERREHYKRSSKNLGYWDTPHGLFEVMWTGIGWFCAVVATPFRMMAFAVALAAVLVALVMSIPWSWIIFLLLVALILS
ncbi:MAG: hypothetical protein IKO55_09725 [Kiritimatiellae bacterium]|nr:hypothetical protein [Kiritimatiellia bacterium]